MLVARFNDKRTKHRAFDPKTQDDTIVDRAIAEIFRATRSRRLTLRGAMMLRTQVPTPPPVSAQCALHSRWSAAHAPSRRPCTTGCQSLPFAFHPYVDARHHRGSRTQPALSLTASNHSRIACAAKSELSGRQKASSDTQYRIATGKSAASILSPYTGCFGQKRFHSHSALAKFS